MPSAANDAYCGRFAPSPTGPLHAGSLVSALASYLDARAQRGRWLIRIEDLDAPRSLPEAARQILKTLDACGMRPDSPPQSQSGRLPLYQAAFDRLAATGLIYPCGCTRREIADSLSAAPLPGHSYAYAGTCRGGLHGKRARAWRLRVPDGTDARIAFIDRWQGPCVQDLAREVGDFIVKRADGQWAYQLAVVVDDAQMGVTDVVRGADLLESTARQLYLQRCLGVPAPRYMHVPVVTDASGIKLSKQNGAMPIDDSRPLDALLSAARHLGMTLHAASLPAFYRLAVEQWAQRFAPAGG